MPRQTVEQKAVQLLAERRLRVEHVGDGGLLGFVVSATCRGSEGGTYRLGFEGGGDWWCSCPARSTCCHLVALQAVVVEPQVREAERLVEAEAAS